MSIEVFQVGYLKFSLEEEYLVHQVVEASNLLISLANKEVIRRQPAQALQVISLLMSIYGFDALAALPESGLFIPYTGVGFWFSSCAGARLRSAVNCWGRARGKGQLHAQSQEKKRKF